MTELRKTTGEKLSLLCGVSPPSNYDQNLIKSKTLDGSYHIQSIGNPIKMKKIEVVVTRKNADIISDMYAKGELIELVEDSEEPGEDTEITTTCLIFEMPEWEYETKTLFRTKLSLMVAITEE